VKRILLIGGSAASRMNLKAALEVAGHRVSAAVARKYTNHWLGHRLKPFDLIIYDLEEAPQPDEFWPELRANAGAALVLVLTTADDPVDWQARGMNHTLRQPFVVDEVAQAANALLGM
jgi:DNA-binding response OmpR family regulator